MTTRRWLTLPAWLALIACAQAQADSLSPVPGTRIQCPWVAQQAAVRIVGDANAWSALAGEADAGFSTPTDWQRESLLVVSLGARPTPGYKLNLQAAKWDKTTGRWTLRLAEQAPPADAILPQVISFPCLILRAPRRGIRELVALDADGKVLAQQHLGAAMR